MISYENLTFSDRFYTKTFVNNVPYQMSLLQNQLAFYASSFMQRKVSLLATVRWFNQQVEKERIRDFEREFWFYIQNIKL